jgi:hypothetical protein
MKWMIVLALLFIPQLVYAVPIVKISYNIQSDCQNESVYACYVRTSKTIYISINAKNISYLFFHEYGHYLTSELPYTKLSSVFGNKDTYEKAADEFYLYMDFRNLEDKKIVDFYDNLLTWH